MVKAALIQFPPHPWASYCALLWTHTTSGKCCQVRDSHLHQCCLAGQTLSVPLLCRNSTAVKKKKKPSAFWEKQQLCVNSISRVGIVSIIIIVLALGLFSQKRAGVSFLERLTAVSGYCSIFWVVYRQGGTAAAFISMPGQRCRFLCVRQSSKQLIVHWTVCAQGHVTG